MEIITQTSALNSDPSKTNFIWRDWSDVAGCLCGTVEKIKAGFVMHSKWECAGEEVSTNKLLSLPSHTHLRRPVSVITFILMETCWIRGGVGRLENTYLELLWPQQCSYAENNNICYFKKSEFLQRQKNCAELNSFYISLELQVKAL